jgi:XapX domain-containing protein
MKEIGLALLAGIIVGFIFKLIKLPLPAPPVMAGIVGIVGIYLGGLIADKIFQLFLIK